MTENTMCYRHPNRETYVSCGKCGKPLCPDCVNHGPVGVRCADCLRPTYNRVNNETHTPTDVDKARWTTLVMVIIFSGILGKLASLMTVIPPGAVKISDAFFYIAGPNLFVSIIAGILTGYFIWRIVGKTWNNSTLWLAAGAGVIMPIAGTILSIVFSNNFNAIMVLATNMHIEIINLITRTIIASLISGGLAALLATNPRNSGI